MTIKKQPAPEPGIHRGVPFEVYASWDALNPSLVKLARDSMYGFHYAEQHPNDTDTAALALGRAVHCAVLEPDTFPLNYTIWQGAIKRGATWDQFKAANCDKAIISAEDWSACCAMRDSVRSHPAASKLFTVPADIETCLVWDDKVTGLRCKGRFDYLALTTKRLLDLKTARSIKDRAVVHAVCDYGYHISMAAYADGYFHLTGENVEPVLLFVSKTAPYECVVRPLSPEAVERGTDIWHELLASIFMCRASGQYPGFADAEIPLDLPPWEMGMEEPLEIELGGETTEVL